MKYLKKYDTETAFDSEVMGIDKAWVTLTEDDAKAHFMEFKTGAAWVGGGESNCVLGGSEEYSSESPVELYETKELTSIKFPAEATELITLDSSNLESVDLSECEVGSPIVEQVKAEVGDDVEVIEPVFEYEYVDLGLPSGLLWATCNVGATKPEEYGDYFVWGGRSKYGEDNNPFEGQTLPNQLPLEYDTARLLMGGEWRMPTNTEFSELLNNTSKADVELNGVNGVMMTSKKNGNTIFFPYAGIELDSGAGYGTRVWTSINTNDTRSKYFERDTRGGNTGVYPYGMYICGFSVRGVIKY